MKPRVQEAINEQINAEQFSAFLYLSMSAWLEREGLPGFARWMYLQYEEELMHADKFFHYINERNGVVKLKAIDQVATEFDSVLTVVEEALKHEKKVTAMINRIMDIAIEESDHATISFLQWYVDEQVEEEASVTNILDALRLTNCKGNGLFMLDRELGERQPEED